MKEEYKEIAAYEGQEITEAVDRLLNDRDFNRWLRRTSGRTIPGWLKRFIVWRLRISNDPLRVVDTKLVLHFLNYLIKKTTDGLFLEGEVQTEQGAFYLTNHRDIVLDAGFLSFLLRTKYDIRPYLGVGNNLFGMQWIEDLMKICRCFAVIRNGGPRDVLRNAQVLSAYIAEKQAEGQSFWMAQREGRAKDCNDRTQPSVLKMLTLAAGDEDIVDALKNLHLTPVAITYEYDPCDYLKAREMQLKRDDATYKKTAKDDMLNMQTGLRGKKGKIWMHVTPCINDELDTIPADASRNEKLRMAAEIIDLHIFRGYHLAESNQAAYRIQQGRAAAEDASFEAYLQSRIDMIDMPAGIQKDVPFLRERLIEMYAYPAANQADALAQK